MVGALVRAFDRLQVRLEARYESILKFTLRRPLFVLGVSFLIFIGSCASIVVVPKTFLPAQDAGEFSVAIELPPGSSLQATDDIAHTIDAAIHKNAEVDVSALTVGGRQGETEVAEFYVHLVPRKQRNVNTSEFKDKLREQLKVYSAYNPIVKDYDAVGGGQRPFLLNIIGTNQKELEEVAAKAFERLKNHPGLKDVTTSVKVGKPEFQAKLDILRSQSLGVSSKSVGMELRAQIEGLTTAKFREEGREYDIRVRLKDDQRDIKAGFADTFVPNLNFNLVRLSDISTPVDAVGLATINRQDRGRYVQIGADIAAGGGLGNVIADINKMFAEDIKLPSGMRYAFIGQAENFQELTSSMLTALTLGVLFIFLVLASLYVWKLSGSGYYTPVAQHLFDDRNDHAPGCCDQKLHLARGLRHADDARRVDSSRSHDQGRQDALAADLDDIVCSGSRHPADCPWLERSI